MHTDCIPADEIFTRAKRAALAPGIMYYFEKDRLKEDCYSRQDLVQNVNQMIKNRGREQDVGLIH